MLTQLPMQFRRPLPDEALMGYVSECAGQYCAHPAGLLELAGCPSSLERAPFIERAASDRIARLLSQSPEDLAVLTYQRVDGAPRNLKLVDFNGVALRRSNLLASRRRLSPASMRVSNHIRALSMIEAIGFCPETWTALTDRCLACRKRLTWPNLEHVSHCHRCGADQRHYETDSIPDHLREGLTWWISLVHPLTNRRLDAMNCLPEKLQSLSPSEVFELILGLADALNPGMARFEAIVPAVDVARSWPDSIIAALETDSACNRGAGPSLSSRLRRYARQSTVLPAIRSLLLHDLARERGCELGTKAELEADLREINGLSVRQAAERMGLAPTEVITLRRAGVIQVKSVMRGRTSRDLLTFSSCEDARVDLADRMPVQEFMQLTGLSPHAVDELIDGGHLERRQNPAIDALYVRVVLRRSKAEEFIRKMRSVTTPLGYDDDDWIPLAKAFVAVGGRPKPYSAFFSRAFAMQCGPRAPANAEGQVDISRLYVCRSILGHLAQMGSRFVKAASGDPTEVASFAVAAEILNCDLVDVQAIPKASKLSMDMTTQTIAVPSLVRLARSLVSHDEINARLGYRERRASSWLRENGIEEVLPGFASRKAVGAKLGAMLPLGHWRRIVKGLTVKQVARGRADLSNREWDLVRCWIPRARRSSRGMCDRAVANAMIWVSGTGRKWSELPPRYGRSDACYSRFRALERRGTTEQISRALAREYQRGQKGGVGPNFVN